jgi:CsoR family transcriptional regulator, copper-sensing transcriptional repressor
MSTAQQDKTLSQLNRIRGQVDGVIKMYEDERLCVDIVRQLMAVRSSLSRVARDVLTSEASRCTHSRKIEELDEILKEALKL